MPAEDISHGLDRGGWMNPYLDADFRVNDVWFSRADAFLLGASTYDAMRAVGPKVTDTDNCVAAALNGRQTIPRVCARRFNLGAGFDACASKIKTLLIAPTTPTPAEPGFHRRLRRIHA